MDKEKMWEVLQDLSERCESLQDHPIGIELIMLAVFQAKQKIDDPKEKKYIEEYWGDGNKQDFEYFSRWIDKNERNNDNVRRKIV